MFIIVSYEKHCQCTCVKFPSVFVLFVMDAIALLSCPVSYLFTCLVSVYRTAIFAPLGLAFVDKISLS